MSSLNSLFGFVQSRYISPANLNFAESLISIHQTFKPIAWTPEWDYLIHKMKTTKYTEWVYFVSNSEYPREQNFSIGDCEVSITQFHMTANTTHCRMIKFQVDDQQVIYSDVCKKKICVRGDYLHATSGEFANFILPILHMGL